MKKGFTMIELIFVIVILGILAAVAIPRLAATRDDAKVAAAATDVATLVTDLGAYYTAQGKFSNTDVNLTTPFTAADLSAMTNVVVYPDGNGSIQYRTDSNDTRCLRVAVTKEGNLTLSADATGTICDILVTVPAVENMIGQAQSFGGKKVVW